MVVFMVINGDFMVIDGDFMVIGFFNIDEFIVVDGGSFAVAGATSHTGTKVGDGPMYGGISTAIHVAMVQAFNMSKN